MPIDPLQDHVCVAALSGAFGVRGEVRLKSFTAIPEDVAAYGPLHTEDGKHSYTVGIVRQVKGGFAVRLGGVLTKEDADALKGVRLYAPRAALPSLPDDEFYHADLIGLDVHDTGGARIGRIKSVQSNGADDLLEVHGPGLKATVLVPFTREAVPTVDLSARRVIVDPPLGLFPDDGDE
ncbi:ribosome maturation factor RimM [Pseudaestuariivita sp.]|uniref:ribosome maturation factor RimM n=1 Tax=Pseudaestuariivita sp. TaxID=2211669 RepID=UPI004058C782